MANNEEKLYKLSRTFFYDQQTKIRHTQYAYKLHYYNLIVFITAGCQPYLDDPNRALTVNHSPSTVIPLRMPSFYRIHEVENMIFFITCSP